jgi:hypothetical protein
VKNMKMRVESIAGRLDFNERRARALEAVVQYKPEGHGGRSPQGGRAFGAEGQGGRGFAAEGQGGRGFAAEGQGARGSATEGAPRGDQGGRASGAEGQGPSSVDPVTGGESLRSRRRRRRRGRRSGPGFAGDGRTDEGQTRDDARGTTDEGRRTGDEGRGDSDEREHHPQGDDQEQRPAAEAHGPGELASERTTEADTPTPAPDSDPDQP